MQKKILTLSLFVCALVAVNWLAAFFPVKWDLTADKRFTVSDATQSMLRNLNREVHVNVYLHGNFPPGFERLENATREMLEEFKSYAGSKLTFTFTDPTIAGSEEQRQKQFQRLTDQGLFPTNLFANEEGKRTERLIFPGALVQSDTITQPVYLLKANKAANAEEQLNQSLENLEFELASTIRAVSGFERKKLGVVVSHTLVRPERMTDLLATLQQTYDLYLDTNNPESYQGLDALIIPKPDVPFSEEEKYKIDQYVVNGGKILLFVDGTRLESIGTEGTYAQPNALNLDDLLYRWGLRINTDLVKDLNCGVIALNVGDMGDKPQIKPMPWRFFPILNTFGNHPITRNTDALYTHFLSSIDTVGGAAHLRKTPLVYSSEHTQIRKAPVLISYNEARQDPDPQDYQSGKKLASVLIEGNFRSLFQNRILPGDPRSAGFVKEGDGGKVLVFSDGDLTVNEFDSTRRTPFPLGYDRISGNIFGNKDFITHALDFLTDPEGLILSRNKQVSIRQLDKIKIAEARTFWQFANVGAPVLLLFFFGGIYYLLYTRKFARNAKNS